MSPILVRIKRLLIAGKYRFSFKAETEMQADSLEPSDIVEAVTNAPEIYKSLRSTNMSRFAKERLYVIYGTTYDGVPVYTKGTIRDVDGAEIYYFFISSKRDA